MSIGRPIEYDRDVVVDAAMNLFWQNGYDATSLHDLLDTTQLSKSSFYQAFGSKRDLFTECVARYTALSIRDMKDRLARARSGMGFVISTLTGVIDEARTTSQPKGCFVVNTAGEFAQDDREIAEFITAAMIGFRQVFRGAIERGQRDGSIRGDLDAESLAGYVLTAMSGLRTMVKAGTDRAALKQTLNVIVDSIR